MRTFEVSVQAGGAQVSGVLRLPEGVLGIVVFVHGTRHLRIGYFGASTGGAAALSAAAPPRAQVSAIVSRGGRPDLAGAALERPTSPTLLIVGGRDEAVLDLNRTAQTRLRCENNLEIVPGATHLFEEPGALERVAELGVAWFTTHLSATRGE